MAYECDFETSYNYWISSKFEKTKNKTKIMPH